MIPATCYAFSDELTKIARAGPARQFFGRLFSRAAPSAEATVAPSVARGSPAYTSGDELLNVMRSADDVVLTGERGIHSLGSQPTSLQQTIEGFEAATKARAAAEAQSASKLEGLLRSGKFNPAEHSVGEFMRTGQIVPKKVVTRAPQWRPEGTSAGAAMPQAPMKPIPTPAALGGPAPSMPRAAPTGPATQISRPGATPRPAAAPPSMPTQTVIHQPVQQGASFWKSPRVQTAGVGAGMLGLGGLGGYAVS